MEATTAGSNHLSHDHVRDNTAPAVNRRIEDEMRARILLYASKTPTEVSQRITELEEEWDIERWLECNASGLALGGIVLSFVGGKKWLLLPALALPMLFYHAVSGWCPPLPLFRRLGVRTRREIDAEIYALRLLRGDFDDEKDPTQRALKALEPELRPVE